MKLVGFIKDYDPNISNASPFSEFIVSNKSSIALDVAQRIIEYLENGFFLTGAMSNLYDIQSGELIGNADYFTDGVYVWPSYFAYFLKKYPGINIDGELVRYLNEQNFLKRQILSSEIQLLEGSFDQVWSKKSN